MYNKLPNSIDFYKRFSKLIFRSNADSKKSGSLKTNSFALNGKQISIAKDDNLISIKDKINKTSSQTGITGKIVNSDKGYRLKLFSKNSIVEIHDNSGILLELYNEGYIGLTKKHLIQITSINPFKPVEIWLNKSPNPDNQDILLSEAGNMIKIIETSYPFCNPLIVLNEV